MVAIASRSSWGARRSDGSRTLAGLASELVIHHSVTGPISANATVATERAHMRVLEDIGYNRFGTGISYNVLVFPSGRAYQGVSFNRQGAHTGGRNHVARAICFVGNFETQQPTAAAIMTAADIVAEGRGKWWTTGAPVHPHQRYNSTACPGRNVISQLPAIRSGSTAGGTSMSARDTWRYSLGGEQAGTRLRLLAGRSRDAVFSRKFDAFQVGKSYEQPAENFAQKTRRIADASLRTLVVARRVEASQLTEADLERVVRRVVTDVLKEQ